MYYVVNLMLVRTVSRLPALSPLEITTTRDYRSTIIRARYGFRIRIFISTETCGRSVFEFQGSWLDLCQHFQHPGGRGTTKDLLYIWNACLDLNTYINVNKANKCAIKQATSQQLIDKQSNINESSNVSNSYLNSLFFVHKMIPYFQSMLLSLLWHSKFCWFPSGGNWLASQRSIKPIWPLIPSFYLDKQLDDDKEYGRSLFKPNPDGCNEWLDSKETGSVVYVSFRSLAALGEEQMAEIAWGLKRCDCCFLWVVRESERKKLPSNFVEASSKKSLLVTWSPQLEVLDETSQNRSRWRRKLW